MIRRFFGFLLLVLYFSISNAGWIDDRLDSAGDSLRDGRNDLNDAADDAADTLRNARDSVATGATNLWNYLNLARIDLGATCTDDEGKEHSVSAGTDCGKWREDRRKALGGFSGGEIALQLEDVYDSGMSNSQLTLEAIEGKGSPFSWVPIINQITFFVPLYSSGIPKEPTDKQIWENTDSDNDGIYDEMEYFISRNFRDNDDFRLASYRYVHSVKQLVDNYDHEDEFRSAMINLAKASNCMSIGSEEDRYSVKIAAYSTLKRLKAILKMNYLVGDLLSNLNRNNHLACK